MTPPTNETTMQSLFSKGDVKTIRTTFWSHVVIVISAMVCVVITFYFTTKSDISSLYDSSAANSKSIEILTKSLNDMTARTEKLASEPTMMQKQMDDMNKRMDRIESTQDKIYVILLSMNKGR